jgi:hypothetical protein
MVQGYTVFNNVLLSPSLNKIENLQQNVEDFFNWGFLENGAYSDVNIQNIGVSGNFPWNLQPKQIQGVALGQIWQAVNINWVYESELQSIRQPIAVGGVFINSTFYPTASTTGAFAHHFDFPRGRVVFNTAIDPTSVVQVNYSYKNVSIYDQNVPWFRELIFDSFGYDSPTMTSSSPSSGIAGLLNDYSIQLPMILMESVGPISLVGKQLGDSSLWMDNVILFHVLTETSAERNNIMAIVCLQKDKDLNLYDVNYVAENNYFPLDYRGMVNVDGKLYPYLTNPDNEAYFDKAYFIDCKPSEVSSILPLYRTVIRVTIRT